MLRGAQSMFRPPRLSLGILLMVFLLMFSSEPLLKQHIMTTRGQVTLVIAQPSSRPQHLDYRRPQCTTLVPSRTWSNMACGRPAPIPNSNGTQVLVLFYLKTVHAPTKWHADAPHVISVYFLETPYGFTTANSPTSDIGFHT
jgi:hypothetical protein